MAAPTYDAEALVCRRTKLGETDVILTLLDAQGRQLRAVAKGARKPSSPFSSRLETGSVCRLLLARGRSLDIVKEARIVQAHSSIRTDHERFAAAAVVLELASKTSMPELENERLYALSVAALDRMAKCPAESLLPLAAASVLKMLAYSGFRPGFDACVACGQPIDLLAPPGMLRHFSAAEGGVLCDECARTALSRLERTGVLQAGNHLLHATFDQVADAVVSGALRCDAAADALQVAGELARAHLQTRLPSVDFLSSIAGSARSHEDSPC